MVTRALAILILSATCLSAAGWDAAAAAGYLDGRQKEWFSWPRAKTPEGTCVSCHGGMPYLLARPALRKKLGESQPTEWETKLLDRLRTHAGDERKVNIQGPEIIFGALFLAKEDPNGDATRKAHGQMWSMQLHDGDLKGIWQWYSAKLDPWESQGAFSFGAALGTLAAGTAKSGSEESAEVVRWFEAHAKEVSLHSRLALLWASSRQSALLDAAAKRAIVDEVLSKQLADGSWTIQSLGPWMEHPDAPEQPTGGHPYATAFATFVLRECGVAPQATAKARDWLAGHQDKETGGWFAPSMNKKYPAGSVESKFMEDAATSFAVLALVD